jgi:hypothetical protein
LGYQRRGEFIHNLDDFWLSSHLVIEYGGIGCRSMDHTHDALFLNWFVGGLTRFGDRAEFEANELLPTIRRKSPFILQQAMIWK